MCAHPTPSLRPLLGASAPSWIGQYVLPRLVAQRHILAQQWPQLGLMNPEGDFTDAEAIAAIIHISGGNFRLLYRLCTEIQRIQQINQLQTVTKEVVETARETLVIRPGIYRRALWQTARGIRVYQLYAI